MRAEITLRSLRDHSRALLVWMLSTLAYVGMILAVYPTIKGDPGIAELVKGYPKGMMALFGIDPQSFDLTAAGTFLNVYLYSAIVPMLVAILAVGRGASLVAGEEERGTLDLVLSYPVTRRRFVVEQALAVFIEVALLGCVLLAAVVAGGAPVGLQPIWLNVVEATCALVLMALAFGWLALAAGCATGSKAVAQGVGAGAVVASYLITAMAALADWVSPLRWVSLFNYATDKAVTDGVPALSYAVLLLAAFAFAGAAVMSFERRDLSV